MNGLLDSTKNIELDTGWIPKYMCDEFGNIHDCYSGRNSSPGGVQNFEIVTACYDFEEYAKRRVLILETMWVSRMLDERNGYSKE